MSMNKVIEVAQGELGYTENPAGSNQVKYWEAYNPEYQGSPWCVAFLWWVFSQAGERMSFFGGGKTASCSILLRWYKEQGLTVPVSEVQIGDIVLLNFSGGQIAEHCGLVTSVKPGSWVKQMETIEGNTSPSDGSQSNGGMVCAKTRYGYQVIDVCRPQYKEEKPVNDWENIKWASKEIKWNMDNGIMSGYPDGSFKPNGTVTRAEQAVINYRLHERFEKELLELHRRIENK